VQRVHSVIAVKIRIATLKTFMLDYRYKACEPGIKEQVVDMAINGSGIRDTARVLKINKNTVISTLKKSRAV
jgi:transposase-like protein